MPIDPSLNEPQRRAVEHSKGPLLVLAGPGSGKTRVVTHRIARLIERGIAARAILAVTFTNKAAREMRERVRKLVGRKGKDLTVATFHSACVRILREEIGLLGYGRNFTIYDESSQESLVRTILRDLKGVGATGSSSALLQAIGVLKQPPRTSAAPPEAGPETGPGGLSGVVAAVAFDPEAAARDAFLQAAHDRYASELRSRNAIDFDDIILLTGKLFRERPEALARWRTRFSHLLVDEYQDTNDSQDEILTLLAGESRNLCVVGDDDQSIYGWRGAEVEHILHFTRRFPGATVVKLEQNYRSTREIVAVASAVIAKNPRRHKKDLFTRRTGGARVRVLHLRDDEEEAETIAKEVGKGVIVPEGAEGNPWELGKGYAVLFRTNEAMRPVEQAFRALKVPYRLIGGRSFFDRKEVIDLLSYLRLGANPDDEEALFRIANVPARGLGARALQALRDEAARTAAANTWTVLAGIAAGAAPPEGISGPGVAGIGRLVEVVQRARREADSGSRTLVSDLVTALSYRDEIDKTYKDPQVRESRANLVNEVQKTWETYLEGGAAKGLPGFLDSLSLRDRDDDERDPGGVTLATVHASKGLEFQSVYVAGLEEGAFPHGRSADDRSLEEERRLFYVAITRAKDRLTLTRSVVRTVRGKEIRTVPSRYLEDFPPELLEERDLTKPAAPEEVVDHLARMRAALGR